MRSNSLDSTTAIYKITTNKELSTDVAMKKPTLSLITLLLASSLLAPAAGLQCLECSEKSNNEATKCSINSTAFRESNEATARCRVWSLNGLPVLRSLVGENLCTEQTLQQNIANDIEGKFPGVGPASAQCCNWTLCNFNTTLAALSEAPVESMENSSTESNVENSALRVIFSICIILVSTMIVMP